MEASRMLQDGQGAALPAEGAAKGNQKKFECPSDFIPYPFTPVPSFTPEKLNNSSTELWLIKAPLDFDPASFNSQKIPMIGFQSVKIKTDGKKRFYNIFSSPGEMGTSRLVVASPENDRLLCGPSFHGYINICDSFGDPSGMLHPVSASPVLQIPEGLKLRFQPFGATAPVRSGEKRGRLSEEQPGEVDWGEPNGGEEETVKRKKKKKRKKHVDEEGFQGNCPVTGQDNEESLCEVAQGLQSTEATTKKRKKKKREKERLEVSATALEMEDTDNESTLAAMEEEVVPEPAESISDETGWKQHKKKRNRVAQEHLEERFAPTAEELGSVFKKKRRTDA